MRGKYQRTYWLYRNKRNEHKFIVIKRFADGHYCYLQFLVYPNGVVNYMGCRLNRHHFSRIHRATIIEVVKTDYDFLNTWKTM